MLWFLFSILASPIKFAVIIYCDINLHFPNEWCWNIFTCLFPSLPVSYLVRNLFKFLFIHLRSYFLTIRFEDCLKDFDVDPFKNIWYANIFIIHGLTFHFLISIFWRTEVLIWIKFSFVWLINLYTNIKLSWPL